MSEQTTNLVKFTVPSGHKAGACAASESMRYATSNVALVPGKPNESGAHANYLIATDGNVLSFLPVEATGNDKPLLLPADSVKANGKETSVEVNGEVRSTNGKKTSVAPLPEQSGLFPAVGSVLPKSGDMTYHACLTLDAELLSKLASAISQTGVVSLFIPMADKGQICKPVIAVGLGGDDNERPIGIGLLMPMTNPKKDYCRQHVENIAGDIPEKTIRFGE